MSREGILTALYTVFLLLAVAPVLASHCTAPAGCTSGVSAICGVEICGVCYHCGAADNICPATYSGGVACGVCDADCVKGTAALENTLAMCNDCGDNDNQGGTNFADASPSPFTNPGDSCNECSVSACIAAGFTNTQVVDGNAVPNTAGVNWDNGTAAQPGSATSKRLDSDGSGGTGSCWCGVCDASQAYYLVNGQCVQDPKACALTAAPVITRFNASPFYPGNNYADFTTTLILEGTVGNGLTGTFQIDTNEDAASYERTDTVSPTSAAVNSIPAGSHRYYARLTDNCLPSGRSVTAYFDVPVAANTAPTNTIAFTPLSKLNDINISWTSQDNQGPLTISFNFTNSGNQILYNRSDIVSTVFGASLGRSTRISQLQPGVYTARMSSTDNGTPRLTSYTTATYTVPCVSGSQLGNATYDDLSSQCCSDSCAREIGGWWTCFAVNSCEPATTAGTMCTNPAAPAFVDRDTSSTLCESSSQTCSMLTWSDLNPAAACCGDDANEHVATKTFSGVVNEPPTLTTNACCTAPGMCYTTAGIAGCYANTAENTAVLCSDGIDNDCDGILDRGEASCYAASVSGTIRFYNEKTGVLEETPSGTANTGTNTQVWISDDDRALTLPGYSTKYGFNASPYTSSAAPGKEGLWIGVPQRKITVARAGYKTQVSSAFTIASGGSYTVDLKLEPRRCDRFCMNDEGFCDISCIGVGECQPTGPTVSQPNKTFTELGVLEACHPRGAAFGFRAGTEVILGANSSDLLVGVCCSVPAQWRRAPAVTAQENINIDKISTLVKYTRLVTLNGRTYKLVINTWDS